jgi:leucyl aminopeptidase
MTSPVSIAYSSREEVPIAAAEGSVVVFVKPDGSLGSAGQQADAATGGAVSRLLASDEFRNKPGSAAVLAYPAGLKAARLVVAALGETEADARKAGGAVATRLGGGAATLYGEGSVAAQAEIAFGLALRLYDFAVYKTAKEDNDTPKAPKTVVFAADAPEAVAKASAPLAALAEGVFFTRDLVNEPANVLSTDDFAARLAAMGELGIEVEILGEDELAKLGMRLLLGVGQGSAMESKVVVMRWMGGGDDAPLALIGKGVVFDTGGISIKPAQGMEEMTMDMGGAGVVAGVMRTLALRKAKANVVGLVGLVENMPSSTAQRPGDVVKSMKGDTVEVINTDAEGRLVLADVLWYTQERFKPKAMVNLATLTGAMVIALGHSTAGFFSNNDAFAEQFAAAAKAAGEQAWRMPLGPDYDKLLKSRIADMKNIGGRPAGSITAAQFLKRFVKDDVPWIHIDIAGVALVSEASDLAPRGATGWGVRALDRLVRDGFEKG